MIIKFRSMGALMGSRQSVRYIGIAVMSFALTAIGLAAPQAANAASGTVYVRGTVTCPSGQPFVGLWVKSSTKGSGYASWTAYPGTSGRTAKFSRTLSTIPLTAKVSVNLGCGNTPAKWRYVYNGLGNVNATKSGTVFINLTCSTTACSAAPRGLGGSIAVNPGADPTQCTWRASDFWKQMTGSYPGWGGNAGTWDNSTGAPSKKWAITSTPQPDTLFVTQPTATNSAGHVGYVADTRVSGGKTQVKIYDRNYDYKGTDRNGVWLNAPSGANYLRVPPRFTAYNR